MPFANDIALADETRHGVSIKLEIWRDGLESTGFRLSRSKIEYMKCELSKMKNKNGVVELDGQEIPKE